MRDKEMWNIFFENAGFSAKKANTYALQFVKHDITKDVLSSLNAEYLRDMSITKIGDIITILRHAEKVSSEAKELENDDNEDYNKVAVKEPVTFKEDVQNNNSTKDENPTEQITYTTDNRKRKLATLSERLHSKRIFERLGEKQTSPPFGSSSQDTNLKLPMKPILKRHTSSSKTFQKIVSPSSVITSSSTSNNSCSNRSTNLTNGTVTTTALRTTQPQKVLLVKKVPLKAADDDEFNDIDNYDYNNYTESDEDMASDTSKDAIDVSQNKSVKFASTAEVHEIPTVSSTSGSSPARGRKPFVRGVKVKEFFKSAANTNIRMGIKNKLHNIQQTYNFKPKSNNNARMIGNCTLASDVTLWREKLPVHARLGKLSSRFESQNNEHRSSGKEKFRAFDSSSVFNRLGS